MTLPAQVPGGCASPARPPRPPPAPCKAEPTSGSHRVTTHTALQPVSPPALPGVGFWALFPHRVPTAGRLLLRWVPAAPPALPCPALHGTGARLRAQRRPGASRRCPPLPPREGSLCSTEFWDFLSLRINQSLHRGHHFTQSPSHLRNAAASSRQPLRAPNSVGRCSREHGGLTSPASPQERRPQAPALLQPLWAACGGERLPAQPRLLTAGPAAAPEPSGTFRRAGLEPCGAAAVEEPLPSRARPAGGSGVRESPECCGSRAGPAGLGPASRSAPGAPRTEFRGGDRAPSISEQHRACKPQQRKAPEWS